MALLYSGNLRVSSEGVCARKGPRAERSVLVLGIFGGSKRVKGGPPTVSPGLSANL